MLADNCLREFGHSIGRPVVDMTPEASEALLFYDWPGNVRELRNVLERTTIPCEDGLIRADDLSIATGPRPAEKDATDAAAVQRTRFSAPCKRPPATR